MMKLLLYGSYYYHHVLLALDYYDDVLWAHHSQRYQLNVVVLPPPPRQRGVGVHLSSQMMDMMEIFASTVAIVITCKLRQVINYLLYYPIFITFFQESKRTEAVVYGS